MGKESQKQNRGGFDQRRPYPNRGQYETRSGLTPSVREGLPFDITTDMVEKYLRDKINTLSKLIEEKTGEKNDWSDVSVYTTEGGKRFLPFIMVIPETALEDMDNGADEDREEIFQPERNDGMARIKKPFYELLGLYMYDHKDANMFKSSSWGYQMGVPRTSRNMFLKMRTPRYFEFNGGRTGKILVLLDPLRVFHDMLSMDSDPSSFIVNIDSWKKMDVGRYKYFLKRVPKNNNKNGNYKNKFINELNAQIRGGR